MDLLPSMGEGFVTGEKVMKEFADAYVHPPYLVVNFALLCCHVSLV